MKNRKNVYHACSRGLAFIAMLFLLGARAMALTPAGTEIRNQSVATYKDANLQPQISTSNEVINIVASVYGLEIKPDKSGIDPSTPPFNYTGTPALEQTTAPGNIAYYHYYLKNTGNTPDTYNLEPAFETNVDNHVIAPNKIEVYYDANGNGQVDAGDILLRSIEGTTLNTAVATPIVAQDATIPLIVAVHTPTNAAQINADDKIHTDINAASVGSGNPNAGIDTISNWNRTLFSRGTGILTATKGADVSTAKPGQTLTYTIEGSNTGSAAVIALNYANEIDLNDDGTLDTNNEGILIIDELDPDKLQVDADYNGNTGSYDYAALTAPTVTTSPHVFGPTKAKIVYWNESDEHWYDSPTRANWGANLDKKPKIALFIPDDNANGTPEAVLAPGQGYKFSFQIKVRSPYSTAQPKLIENQVEATYNNGTIDVDVESNNSMVTVGTDPSTATPGVAIGPFTYPLADTAASFTSTNHPAITKTLTVESDPNLDTTKAGIRDAGEVVAFPLTILNPNEDLTSLNGEGGPATSADTYTIAYDPTTVPAGCTVVLYKGDGTTPLADTNSDGKPDTGAIDPNGRVNIVVKVFIAANASINEAKTIKVTATSTNNPAISDPTYLHIQQVRPAGVDIATLGELGKNDNATSATASENDDDALTTDAGVVPGTVIDFQVQVANMRPAIGDDTTTTVADTYKLSYTPVTAGAEKFTVVLLHNINGNTGNTTVDPDELQPISDTGWLPAAENLPPTADEIFYMHVRVTVPKGTPAGNYYIKVTATSTNNPDVKDDMHILVKVNAAPSIEITPDNTATVLAGGSYIFSHVVTNTGNVASAVTLNHSPLPNGYSAVWVSCEDGSIIGTGNPISSYNIAVGDFGADAQKHVCLKVFVPANEPSGKVVPITVIADMDAYDVADYPASTDTALDIITVIDGALKLEKSRITSASGTDPAARVPPAGTITYTTEYKNLSPGTLTTAYIADAIPAHTKLVGPVQDITATRPVSEGGASINARDNSADFQYSTDGGATWSNFTTNPPLCPNHQHPSQHWHGSGW